MKRSLFSIISILLVVFSCSPDNEKRELLSDAKVFFNNNANMLSLPVIGDKGVMTKGEIDNVYPDWDNALVLDNGSEPIVKVPLDGSCRMTGVLLYGDRNNLEILKSATKSFLVLDYRKTNNIPSMYVETIIEKGNKVSAKTLSNNYKKQRVVLVSELDGTLRKVTGYSDNAAIPIDGKKISKNPHSKHKLFGYRIAYQKLTKSSGCPVDSSLVCPVCGESLFPLIDYGEYRCPKCHRIYSEDLSEFCPICGRLWVNCVCEPDNICLKCGLWADGCEDENCGCGCCDH